MGGRVKMTNNVSVQQLPRGSEFNRSSERPQQGAKMTVMDILEFRDMNGPAPMPKSGVMRSNKVRWAISPPPHPF